MIFQVPRLQILQSRLRFGSGRGGGVDEEYGEEEEMDEVMRLYYGAESGDERLYFLDISLISDEIKNAGTLDNIVVMVVGLFTIVATAVVVTRQGRLLVRR